MLRWTLHGANGGGLERSGRGFARKNHHLTVGDSSLSALLLIGDLNLAALTGKEYLTRRPAESRSSQGYHAENSLLKKKGFGSDMKHLEVTIMHYLREQQQQKLEGGSQVDDEVLKVETSRAAPDESVSVGSKRRKKLEWK